MKSTGAQPGLCRQSVSGRSIFCTGELDPQDNPCGVLFFDISELILNQILGITRPDVLDLVVFPIWRLGGREVEKDFLG